MKINSDINVLGSLPDLNLINVFLNETIGSMRQNGGLQSYTTIKTDKSVKRYESAISETILKFSNERIEKLVKNILYVDGITNDSLLMLFWNASYNNELLTHLNEQVYFASFFSGRVSIKQDEVVACLKDLRETEPALKKWSDSTMRVTASKYLTLLKKFGLMQGGLNKSIVHPYLNDKMFIHFVYWICAVEVKPNIIESIWLKYSFSEKQFFVERVLQKKYAKYFQVSYTGDKLKIETSITYENIYNAIK